MNLGYPFSAIVGQEQLKTALLICAVSPNIGGVVIRGDKGTAKSTAARSLSNVLPPIDKTAGCAFNCAVDEPLEICTACNGQAPLMEVKPVPFVNLPLGATEDRVVGSLDFEKALKAGKRAFQPGLLASAHRGILYIDEVNLLPDHLVDVLLDAAAMGTNSIEREGLSLTHPAKFALIGTMNLEEGDLRPQLIDRFAMMIDIQAPVDPSLRCEVVRRRLAFETDPEVFIQRWSAQEEATRESITVAKRLLGLVELDDSLLNFISTLSCEFNIASLRADIVMNKAARAIAALNGRRKVIIEDIRQAAELVLPHRRRRRPGEQAGLDHDRLNDLISQAPPSGESPSPVEKNAPSNQSPACSLESKECFDPDTVESPQTGPAEHTFKAAAVGPVAKITSVQKVESTAPTGRRSSVNTARRGHYVRATPDANPSSVAVDATIRHSVIRNQGKLEVAGCDLHQKVLTGKTGNLIILVVDASGSMAALKRMEAVKGSVVSLLSDMYQRRDQVGVITFRANQAELALAPTRSVELAEQRLSNLPTGGRTPLSHALTLAVDTIQKVDHQHRLEPLLVLITDGRANVAMEPTADPWREALQASAVIHSLSLPSLVVDTESGYPRFGKARELADVMSAEYLPLDYLSSETLTITIASRIKRSKTR